MALMGLTLLVVSGIGLFSLVHANQVATTNADVTTTANANATATTTAVDASSTAALSTATVNALIPTATATRLQNVYNNAMHKPPALDDPLRDNSKGYGWSEGDQGNGGNCAFTGGAYHVSQTDPNYLTWCSATTTDFSNFVFEVQMKIIKGDVGGIIFRNSVYTFDVGQDGSYQLLVCASTCTSPRSFNSSAIKVGLNQTNLIAVSAQGSAIGLYVNHQLIDSLDDSTSSSGQIGVIASPSNNNPTEVVYSNAKVWTL